MAPPASCIWSDGAGGELWVGSGYLACRNLGMIAFSPVLFRMLCGPASEFRSRVPGFRRVIFTDDEKQVLVERPLQGGHGGPQGRGTLPWEGGAHEQDIRVDFQSFVRT